jgi:hypothetical protein
MKGCLLIVVLIIGVVLVGTLWAWNQWGDRLTSPDKFSLQHTWDKYVKPNIIEDNKDYVVVRYDAKRQAIYDRYNKELQRAKDLGLDTGDLKRVQIAVNVTQQPTS